MAAKSLRKDTAQETVAVVTQTRPMQSSVFFRGRDGKLSEVKKLLTGDAKLMLLNGMGGIGKTEFCRKLFNDSISGKLLEIKKTGWLVFHGSLEQTFFQQFTELSFQTDSPAEYLTQAVRYLNDQSGGLLLFIDNANELSEKDAALLAQLRCKVVLTSRRRSIERLQAIEIGKLSLKDCRILYRLHCMDYPSETDDIFDMVFEEDDSPDEDLDAIIEMADRHTLAVELLAKTQRSAAYTIREMRGTLNETGFSLTDISESISYVHTPEANEADKAEKIFIEQFSKVLDITNIKNEKLRVLQLFSLLSTDIISPENVKEWFEIDNLDTVNALVLQGWVFRGRIGEQLDVAFSMHPLITSVIRHKALPSFEIAAPLAIGLGEVLSYDDTDLFTSRLPHLNHAISLVEAISGEYDEYPDLINCIAIILNQMADYNKALMLLEKAKLVCETVEDIDSNVTSTVYHNMAGCYIRQGNLASAKEWYQKSIEIREREFATEDAQIANSYDCYGNVFELLGEYKEALNLMERGLEIRMATLGDKHPQTAISHNNIGCVYDSLGEYRKALEHHKTAMTIQTAALDKHHPDLAATYNNIGRVYDRLGDIKNALKYYNIALESGEAIFGHDHPEVLTARDSIANAHMDAGEYEVAREQFSEILDTRLRVLGEHHQDTAMNYHNLGTAYYYLFQFDKAMEFFDKALEISIPLLGERHPNIAFILRSKADVYSEYEDMDEEALELYKKVLEIQLEAFGEMHPYVAISYNNLGGKYAESGDYERAMEHYEKALHIHENTVGRKNPDTVGTLYNIGRVYKERKIPQRALEYFIEAYEISKKCYGEDVPEIATISSGIANAYDKLGDFPNANKWFENSIRLYLKFFGDDHLRISVTYRLYAESLERQERDDKALAMYTKAYNIQAQFYEADHIVMKNTDNKIKSLSNEYGIEVGLNG